MGTFTGARRYVLQTFATTHSDLMKKRVSRYLVSTDCPECGGKRLRREALAVTFAGRDIAETSALPLKELAVVFRPYVDGTAKGWSKREREHPEKVLATQRIAQDFQARLSVLLDLGLGYLALDRSTPTLSPGELQRLRLATQVRSNLFGVVYVLDEPSAGLHPADTEALLRALDKLKASGNSLFVVEHNLDVIRHADWIVDVGPAAGEHGGEILYSGPPAGLARIDRSSTRRYLFTDQTAASRTPRTPQGWLHLGGITRNNLKDLDVAFPRCVLTTVTGVSGSGKSSLVSQALVELVGEHLGHENGAHEDDLEDLERACASPLADASRGGSSTSGAWCASIRSRSGGPRGPTSRRTPASSITFGGCSRRQRPQRAAGTMPADSRSTSPRDGAATARGKVL
jgi:excinuclease ABC subunit A